MRVVLFLVILITANVSRGEGTRLAKADRVFKTSLEDQMPKGPVPPSGPSPCHNKLDPFKERKFYFPPPNSIICP